MYPSSSSSMSSSSPSLYNASSSDNTSARASMVGALSHSRPLALAAAKAVEATDTDLVAVFLRIQSPSSLDFNFNVCATTVVSAFMVARTGNISRRLRVPCRLGLFFLFPCHMRCGRKTGLSRTDSEIDGSVPGYFSWGEKSRRIFKFKKEGPRRLG